MNVQTAKGLVPFEQLAIVDTVQMEENARVVATEYALDGEIVRRDVWVVMLHGQESEILGALNG